MIQPLQPAYSPFAGPRPGAGLRAPGQLLGEVSARLPQVSPDRLSLSAVSRRLAALFPGGSVFAPQAPGAGAMPAPASTSKLGSEQRSFDGVAATIHWQARFTRPSGAARIPAGYAAIKGALPKGLSQAATAILKQGNPLGSYTPFRLGGKDYLALNEYHSHYASRPKDPPGRIYAITVFEKI